MKFTNKKRGFTIVELIIVIAVIAVLAAVLIPVFSGLIQQGKDAEAKVVVNTLNKGLAMTTTKPATMQDALEAVETNVGINVAKLDETYAKTGNKILWDSEYNTFLFVTKDGDKVSAPNVDKFTDKEINLWAVAKTTDDLKDNYSHYWYGGDVAAVEVATGFDAGVASINAITYKTDAAQSVVIRTNSEKTELTINAKNSDVQHYDVAGNVKVLAVKGASYHEYGNVIGTVTVESGHVQIESGAEVASVIASKSASETVAASVTAASGATVGTVVVDHASASVEVKGGATVAEVAPGKDVTIDTSKVTGITPSTTVIDTEKASDFAGGLGTEVSPYLIGTAEQFVNIKNLPTTANVYIKLVDDFEIDFANLISTQWTGYNWFTYSAIGEFKGVLDGNNHMVTLPGVDKFNENTSALYASLIYSGKSAKVTNLSLNQGTLFCDATNVTIDGVTTYGNMSFENNAGMLIGNVFESATIINCVNKATVNSTSYSAVFIGYNVTDGTKLTFKNSYNEGVYVGFKSALFLGNKPSGSVKMVIDNCGNRNGGTIRATDTASSYKWNSYISIFAANKNDSFILNGKEIEITEFVSTGFAQGPNDSLAIVRNTDNTFTITKSSISTVDHYVVSVSVYSKPTSVDGTQAFSVEETIAAFSENTKVTTIKYLPFTMEELTSAGELCGWNTVSDGSKLYYQFNKDGYTVANGTMPSVTVIAFDANGAVLSSTTLSK